MLSYKIALGLFIIGFVFSGIQESGMYSTVVLPNTGITISKSDAEAVAASSQQEGLNPYFMISLAMKFGRVILTAFATVLTILPLMMYYLPASMLWIAMMFQGPIYLVYIVDIADWWRGTRTS